VYSVHGHLRGTWTPPKLKRVKWPILLHNNLPRLDKGRSILANTNLQAQSVRALDDCLDDRFLDLSVVEVHSDFVADLELA
jgi:hypothetical protein